MKLSWGERCSKKLRIRVNRRILASMLKRHIVDDFAGKPRKTVEGNRIWMAFDHISIGVHKRDRLDDLSLWEHELVEHAVGKVIYKLLVEDGITLDRLCDIISDGILLRGIDGSMYNPTAKHIITALCTTSGINGNLNATSEEFAEFFGFKKRPRSVMENAAPFEGVRCRFEFGRGLQWDYALKCNHDFHKYGLMKENKE